MIVAHRTPGVRHFRTQVRFATANATSAHAPSVSRNRSRRLRLSDATIPSFFLRIMFHSTMMNSSPRPAVINTDFITRVIAHLRRVQESSDQVLDAVRASSDFEDLQGNLARREGTDHTPSQPPLFRPESNFRL